MKNFCAITPDRGDRPEFTAHCLLQMERQTVKPGNHFLINYRPINDEPDLITRIRAGVELAKRAGYEIIFIVENDDYYPDNYIETMLQEFETSPEVKAVGWFETLYYHIGTQKHKLLRHPDRASLFCTAFKIEALEGFQWPESTEVFLDLALWFYFKRYTYTLLNINGNQMPVGIKHGIGLCGGGGHNTKSSYYNNQDINFEYLATLLRPESLEFYKQLTNKENKKPKKPKVKKLFKSEQNKYRDIWKAGNYASGSVLKFANLVLNETLNDGRILEIGCGDGQSLNYIRKNNRFALGCDITLEGVNNQNNGIYYECAAWELFPFRFKQFEYTCSTDVLEHIPPELIDETIREIFRVTSRKTIHVISTEPAVKDYEGHKVHLTVKPIDWWRNKFLKNMPNRDIDFMLINVKDL